MSAGLERGQKDLVGVGEGAGDMRCSWKIRHRSFSLRRKALKDLKKGGSRWIYGIKKSFWLLFGEHSVCTLGGSGRENLSGGCCSRSGGR